MDPTPSPLPVRIVELSPALWEYGDKLEEFARLALWFGALSMFVVVALVTGLLMVNGLRR